MKSQHTPVLLEEVIKALALQPGDEVIDGTLGAGGHTQAILAAVAPAGRVLAFDQDPQAIAEAQKKLVNFLPKLTLINDSFSNLNKYVDSNNFNNVAGVLLDLGFSSTQLADRDRGFSFQTSGLLDLRYNRSIGQSAAELLNNSSQAVLEKIFRDGGETAWRRLAKVIVEVRRLQPFKTTDDLLAVVEAVKGFGHRSLHPATLVWQSLRIVVNDELNVLKQGLAAAVAALKIGGRLAVISFHSGEDRIVKNFMRQESKDCLCPPAWPVCRCHHHRSLQLVNKKVIEPTEAEINRNPRARSAKLRIAVKISN